MAGIMPCSALICLRGFNWAMLPFFKRNKYIESAIIALCLFFVVYSPFKHDYFPYKLDNEQAVIKEAGDWFKSSPYKDQKVYYLYPLLAHVLNVDSFDPEKVGELWGLYPSIKAYGIGVVPDSTIIFWDGHFGPNECRIPLDTIMNDPRFELLKKFSPAIPFKVLGGYDFDVYAFIKLHAPKKMDTLSVDFFDLEGSNPLLVASESIIENAAFSGKNVCELSAKNEYSVTIKKSAATIPQKTLKFDFNCKLLDADKNSKGAVVVMSVEDETGKSISWAGKPLVTDSVLDYKNWNTARVEFLTSSNSIPANANIKFYIWNKELKTFYVDDITLSYWGK
jgi:hypothetical protein